MNRRHMASAQNRMQRLFFRQSCRSAGECDRVLELVKLLGQKGRTTLS